MQWQCSWLRQRFVPMVFALSAFCVALRLPAMAANENRLHADDYVINAELDPRTHHISASVKVKVTALSDVSTAIFDLHNDLRPTKIVDDKGHSLQPERVSQDSTIRVPLAANLVKGSSATLTIDYEGVLANADDSPVEGINLAYIGDPETILLYAGRWFPVVQYGIDRFTATLNITVPSGTTVVGSGKISDPKPIGAGRVTYTLVSNKASFPGTIVAGHFAPPVSNAGSQNIKIYFLQDKQPYEANYADMAEKEFTYFSGLYGPAPSTLVNVVEIPDDSVPATWAPDIAGISARNITEKVNYRLLANTLAHQWWGVSLSPAGKSDYWLQDGFARYSEVRYVEEAAGQQALQDAVKDIEVGALAYDTTPLSTVDKLDMFSPQFQSLVTDKGAMILHMLRWYMGADLFDNTVRPFAIQSAGKPVSSADFQAAAEQHYGQPLTAFFSQWLEGTGAPEFRNKYTVFRTAKGFRIVGEVSQDLDLFRMPVEVKVDTDGRTETKRIDVVGTNSPYTLETFGRPRRIVLDPNNWVLKNSPDLKIRIDLLRGQQLVAQGDLNGALQEYQKALQINSNSSLAHYRIAEVFFEQHNYQSAANAYREALTGDIDPRWTEVWSHVQLGKIFDLTGQRERATNEYRQALQTNDNTQGAIDEARKYLNSPYKPQKDTAGQ